MRESAFEVFREACGLSGPLTLEVRDSSTSAGESTVQIHQPFAIVGRDPGADLVLQNPRISRRHAYLQVTGGRVLCTDLHSRTKMRWGGESGQRDRGWLAPGRDVWLGPYALRWTGESSWDGGGPTVPALPAPSPTPALDLEGLPRAGLALPQRQTDHESFRPITARVALVGRSESCHLVLGHESVSRFHASLIRTPKGVWVVDLLAREGVRVNGQRVRWAWLEDGDAVRFGRFTFVLRYETPPEHISREDVPLKAGASAGSFRPSSRQRPGSPSLPERGLAVRSRERRGDFLAAVPSPDALAPEVIEPAIPAAWELSGAIPPQQIAMWQQQMRMMETFHDDMMMMVQMFMAMHKEHLESVRSELDKVRELSRELGSLQSKLDEPAEPPRREKRLNGGGSAPGAKPASTPEGNGAGRTEAPKDPEPEPNLWKPSAALAQPEARRDVPVPVDSEVPEAKRTAQTRLPPGAPTQFHLEITRKINELQRERQGYWQRILSVISKQSD